MKIHFVRVKDFMPSFTMAFTLCGIHRSSIDSKAETKKKRLVSCKKCLRIIGKGK